MSRIEFKGTSRAAGWLSATVLAALAGAALMLPQAASAQAAMEAAMLNSAAADGTSPRGGAAQRRMRVASPREETAVASGPSCPAGMRPSTEVRIGAGRSVLLNLPSPVVRRTLGDPAVVDSQLVSPQVLYLAAGRVGATNAILQGRDGLCSVLEISVGIDIETVRAKLAEILPDERHIVVSAAADSLILGGVVTSAMSAEHAVAIANAYVRSAYQQGASAPTQPGAGGGGASTATLLREKAEAGGSPVFARVVNLMSVGAAQQVMLEVKVAEVSKTVLDEFGINFSRAYALGDGSAVRFLNGLLGGQGVVAGQIAGTVDARIGAGVVGSINGGNTTGGTTVPFGSGSIGGSSPTIPLARGKNVTMVGVNAQKQDGLVKVLAEPTVMAISGQEGSFLAGGKIFIPVAQSGAGGSTTYSLEEKPFGVSLTFRPTVLADGRIHLQVSPEVSELSSTGVTVTSSVNGQTSVLPAFTTRKASTTVQLYDGQSFAIGGLIKNNVTGNVNAFPILGELPVIGALFRSTSFQSDRSELVFVVTPRLVKPLPPDYVLPTDSFSEPTRSEVIFEGRLEGKSAPHRAAPILHSTPSDGGLDLQ